MASPEDSDEEYLDDPIQLIDFEQKRVFDLCDKRICEEYDQADSEGELFIQKTINNLQKNCFGNEYSKTALNLPVTFFDIAQNVEYLEHCRPLVVKIVDCDKHPWYYKKYIRNDKRRDDEIVDVGVENYIPPYNKNSCSNKCDNSEEMHNQQSRPKIRPVETPYEVLKNVNTTGKPSSPKTEIPLKDWQKLIKQKAIDQRNDLQVDFRKNLGLIGLKISHTTATIKTPKKEKRSKNGKNKPNVKYADDNLKKNTHDIKIMKVKNANIFKDNDDAKESRKLREKQNSDVAPVKSTPPNLIKHPVGVQESSVLKIPDCLPKVSDGINLAFPHSGAVKSGLISIGKISENVSPAKSVHTVLKKSATLNKGQLTASPRKLLQNNGETPASSVSNHLLKLPQSIIVGPTANKMTNLPRLPDLTITSSKNVTHLPKLPEAVNNTLFKNTSSNKLLKPPESMNVINNSNKNNLDIVHSHFFAEMQREKQKLTPIKEKMKRFDDVQKNQSYVDPTPAKVKDQNKTLISILNRKVLNNDNIDQSYSVENVQNDHKSDKTKIVKSKVAAKSNPPGGKKNNDILKMKLFKPQKKGNKSKGTRFTEFKETSLNDRKTNEVTCSTKMKEVVNDKNEKEKMAHRSNASESAILQDECKKISIVEPAIKSSPVPAINDRKVTLPSSHIAENEEIAAKGNHQDIKMINNFAPNSFAQNCVTLSNTQTEIMASAPQVPQTAINNSKKTITTAPSLSFQTQRENIPVKLVGNWVPTSQISTLPNNSVTSNNLNTENGQKTSKVSRINVTISVSPSASQTPVQCTTAQMQSSMNPNTTSLNTGIAPRTISKQQKQSLKSPFVVKMRETIKIPCHLNIPSQTKGNTKMISVRRKSVSGLLEAYGNLMQQANNVDANKTPPCTSRPASTFNVNAPINLTAPMQPYATLNPYNPNYLRPKTHPNTNLFSPSQNKQSRRDVNLRDNLQQVQDNLQQVLNPGASHLQNSPMLFNLNAAAQQIMPQQKKQQFKIGKLGTLQENKVLPTFQQNATSNCQLIVQPTTELTPEQLRSPLWTDNPRQQAVQHQIPPTCDVAPPQIVRNPQHPNELLHAPPTLKLPNFNVPPPTVHAMHAPKQGMVPQPIPVLQRNIQPEYRPDMNPHFVSNTFSVSAQNNFPLQHQAYSQQFNQQNRGIDCLNIRHCAPIYDNVPQNVSVNTVPHMQTAWNYYYPNMMMPPPPPPYSPQHHFKQNAKYVLIDPNQVRNQQSPKSVAGTTVIGCNDTGLVRKININSTNVETIQDPIDRDMSTDKKAVPIGFNIEKPVASKKEMMEELNRETAIISPPNAVLGVLKFCTEREKNSNNSVEDNSHSVTVDVKLNIPSVKDNSQINNFSSPKQRPIFETNVVTDNVIAKELSINKSPYNSVRENAPLIQEYISNSYEMEKSSKQVLKTPTSSSSPNKEKNLNNVMKTSSTISNKEDLKRPLLELDTVSKAVTSQTLIKRPKPGPLSRKPIFHTVSNAQLPVEGSTVAHKGYSPPILPIPSYTKSLELLAQSSHESELRNVVDFAENQFKQPDIPKTGSKKNLTEEEKDQEEKAVKRISLHEYKKRDLKYGSKEEMRDCNIDQLEIKNETHDQDLGYDSDSTMRM